MLGKFSHSNALPVHMLRQVGALFQCFFITFWTLFSKLLSTSLLKLFFDGFRIVFKTFFTTCFFSLSLVSCLLARLADIAKTLKNQWFFKGFCYVGSSCSQCVFLAFLCLFISFSCLLFLSQNLWKTSSKIDQKSSQNRSKIGAKIDPESH